MSLKMISDPIKGMEIPNILFRKTLWFMFDQVFAVEFSGGILCYPTLEAPNDLLMRSLSNTPKTLFI